MPTAADPELQAGLMEERWTQTRETRMAHGAKADATPRLTGTGLAHRRSTLVLLVVLLTIELLWIAGLIYFLYSRL
jgi:hypothetical protein